MVKGDVKPIDPRAVEPLAAQGLTIGQIASSLGVSRTTLYTRMGSEKELRAAVKRGRHKGLSTIANALFNTAKGGNFAAQKYYLSTRDPDRWAESQRHEISGLNGGPIEFQQIVFNPVGPGPSDES